MKKVAVIGLFLTAVFIANGRTCTTFCLNGEDHVVVGKNYDWNVGVGAVLANPRGVKRATSADNPTTWEAHFGSITFNQYGAGSPNGGINEAGLVVELMWLDDTDYAEPDDRATIGVLQWIQYQLDNAATVEDVVASDKRLRVSTTSPARIHYLVVDASGDVATVEFLGGEMVVHRGAELAVPVLTNSTYAESVSFLREYENSDGAMAVAGNGSLQRFCRAVDMVGAYEPADHGGVDYAFTILAEVAQPGHTRWQIVYDVKASEIHFVTSANASRRSVALKQVDFDCAAGLRGMDIHAEQGDITAKLKPFAYEENFALIKAAYNATRFLSDVPDAGISAAARSVESVACAR